MAPAQLLQPRSAGTTRRRFRPIAQRLFPGLLATAAIAAEPRPESAITRAEPVVVEESRLTADAAGTTQVRIDGELPTASRSLTNVASRVANLHLSAGGAGSYGDLLSLRGLANTPYFSDPSVALYFDDLPLGSAFTYPVGLFGFATATISRGPQGSAAGRGGEGGLITLTSAEPGARAGGEVRAGLGNFQARSAAVTASSARRAGADVTASAAFTERAGFITNTTLGKPVDDQQSIAAATRVRVRPSAASELTFQFLGSRHRAGAQPLVPAGGPLFSVARGREGATRINFGGGALKGAFDTGIGRLSATTSYTDWSLDPYDNRLVLPPTLDSRILQTQRTWNEEIRLAANPRAPVAWRLGVWWSRTQTHGDVNRALVLGGPTGIPIEISGYALGARSRAVFGEATLGPLAGWRLTPAFRAETTDKAFDRSQRAPGPGHFTGAKSFGAFLPKLSANRSLGAVATASVSIGRGTKPGGWSAYTGNATLAPFAAEHVTGFEAGIDTAFVRQTFRLAARVFDYEIEQLQIERSFNAADYLVVNAPRARSRGGEVELTWRPAAAWSLAATLGVTDITLHEFTDPFTRQNLAGRRAPYAPAYDAQVGATWRDPSGWFAAAELAATGRTFFDESENPLFAARAHTVVAARFGRDLAGWRLSLFGENLGDARYVTLIIPGVRHASPGAPRTFGFEAVKKW